METSAVAVDAAFVVGAYAAVPAEPAARDEFHRLLAQQDWVHGLEIPFPGELAEHPEAVWGRLHPEWTANTVTAIPGTMQRLQVQPQFGLASADADGRSAALAFARDIRDRLAQLSELAGHQVVGHVQLHSSPTAAAHAEALGESLTEVLGWDWSGARIVIEHCDSLRPGQVPEKGFLSLADEVDVAARLGVGIHVNWGRSAIDERDPDAPLRHVVAARDAGVLRGLLFSGAAETRTSYGAAWADGHLPTSPDEPASLLTPERIRACADAARGSLDYLGAKICVPAEATPERRLAMLRTVRDAIG
ncbi:DUF4862 family protein [Tessaracoccus terricola]